jgi:hypothetical protein
MVTVNVLDPLLQLRIVAEAGTFPKTGAVRSLTIIASVVVVSDPSVSVAVMVTVCVPIAIVVERLGPVLTIL